MAFAPLLSSLRGDPRPLARRLRGSSRSLRGSLASSNAPKPGGDHESVRLALGERQPDTEGYLRIFDFEPRTRDSGHCLTWFATALRHVEGSARSLAMIERFVMDAMTKNPVMVGADWDAEAMANEARQRGVRHLIVTDGVHLLGVVARVDLALARGGAKVAEFIECAPVTIEEDAKLEQASTLMDEWDVDCLPVLNREGLLVGVLTRGDVRRSSLPERPPEPIACAACGDCAALLRENAYAVGFCEECWSRARASVWPDDDGYIVLGGGD